MKRMAVLAVLSVATFALLQPLTTSGKNPVDRPTNEVGRHHNPDHPGCPGGTKPVEHSFRMWNDYTTVVYDPYPDAAVLEEEGRVTGLGHFTTHAEHVAALENGLLIFSGVATFDDGDQLHWTALINSPVGFVVLFTGGTGRFENASGGSVAKYTEYELDSSAYPVVVINFKYEATGTITY